MVLGQSPYPQVNLVRVAVQLAQPRRYIRVLCDVCELCDRLEKEYQERRTLATSLVHKIQKNNTVWPLSYYLTNKNEKKNKNNNDSIYKTNSDDSDEYQ